MNTNKRIEDTIKKQTGDINVITVRAALMKDGIFVTDNDVAGVMTELMVNEGWSVRPLAVPMTRNVVIKKQPKKCKVKSKEQLYGKSINNNPYSLGTYFQKTRAKYTNVTEEPEHLQAGLESYSGGDTITTIANPGPDDFIVRSAHDDKPVLCFSGADNKEQIKYAYARIVGCSWKDVRPAKVKNRQHLLKSVQ